MNRFTHKFVAFSSFVVGLALLVPLATYAGQRSTELRAEPAPVSIPEVVITGRAPIVLPEVVISASPSKKAKARKASGHPADAFPVGFRALDQGGRPGARFVRAF